VRFGAERDDTGVAAVGESVVQAQCEREVAEMVGRELQLHAVPGQLFFGQEHAGVVDEDVQRPMPACRECGDRIKVGEVEPADSDSTVLGRGGDLGRGSVADLDVADGERDLGACTGQRPGGLDPDA
jgi:hypothetical protein